MMMLLQCCHPVLDPSADPGPGTLVIGLASGLVVCGVLFPIALLGTCIAGGIAVKM